MKERWREIIGEDGHFFVSNLGRVRSRCRMVKRPLHPLNEYMFVEGKFLSTDKPNNMDYVRITLPLRKSVLVHVLVAEAFIWEGKRPRGKVVNHRDGNKCNNNIRNLESVTPSENLKHAYKTGLNWGNRLATYEQRLEIIELLKKGVKTPVIAKMYNFRREYVTKLRNAFINNIVLHKTIGI